jgi:VanZ family protein
MSPLPASDVTGRRLGHAVLAYLAVVVAVVTLTPFRFVVPPVNTLTSTWNGFDLVMNVVMFVPLGFIHRLSKPRATGRVWVGAILWGAALSGLIELAQFFAPGRFPSPFDLVTNTAGAGIGAWLGTAVLHRADAEATVRALAVELPLMGLVYLLAPLPWLIGLDSRIDERAWLLVPLAASAGWIIGSVFTSFDRAGLPRVLLATAAWLFVALVPSALGALDVVTIAAGAGLGTAWIRSLAPSRVTHESGPPGATPSRRFEASTLRIVLPLLVIHLVASSLTPLSGLGGTWRGTWALLPDGTSVGNDVIFRAIEHISAFLVIGYAIAEYHGRRRDGFAKLVPAVLGWAAVGSVVLEAARGWHAEHTASATMLALSVAASGLGGWLYTLQLAHVRAVAARRAAAVMAGMV